VSNLQPRTPPPAAPPPPPRDTRADELRTNAELDGLLQEKARKDGHERMAAEVARQLAATAVATPMQTLIREHHYHTLHQPINIHTPAVPTPTSEVRHTGQSFHEIFIRDARQPPDEIPIHYNTGGRPPPPAPGSDRVLARSYGPAKLAKARLAPWETAASPAAPAAAAAKPSVHGGATAPYAGTEKIPTKLKTPRVEPQPAPFVPEFAPPERVSKRKAPRQAEPVGLKAYRVPRGMGHRLDGPKDPFGGSAQRLPPDVVDNARARMLEIAKRANATSTSRRNFDTLKANERKQRRGGAQGDVVAAGKRKQPEADAPLSILRKSKSTVPNSRQRLYGPKTQVFDLDAEPIRVY
jgi:hypothetical protein